MDSRFDNVDESRVSGNGNTSETGSGGESQTVDGSDGFTQDERDFLESIGRNDETAAGNEERSEEEKQRPRRVQKPVLEKEKPQRKKKPGPKPKEPPKIEINAEPESIDVQGTAAVMWCVTAALSWLVCGNTDLAADDNEAALLGRDLAEGLSQYPNFVGTKLLTKSTPWGKLIRDGSKFIVKRLAMILLFQQMKRNGSLPQQENVEPMRGREAKSQAPHDNAVQNDGTIYAPEPMDIGRV